MAAALSLLTPSWALPSWGDLCSGLFAGVPSGKGFSCCCHCGVRVVANLGGEPLPAGELAPPASIRAQCVSCRHRPRPGLGRPGWKGGGGC